MIATDKTTNVTVITTQVGVPSAQPHNHILLASAHTKEHGHVVEVTPNAWIQPTPNAKNPTILSPAAF